MTKKAESQCVVSADDYAAHFNKAARDGTLIVEPYVKVQKYSGPERRANAHDRRFYNGMGGRRRFDRKS